MENTLTQQSFKQMIENWEKLFSQPQKPEPQMWLMHPTNYKRFQDARARGLDFIDAMIFAYEDC